MNQKEICPMCKTKFDEDNWCESCGNTIEEYLSQIADEYDKVNFSDRGGMKIITINVPVYHIKAIAKLTKVFPRIFPSRSEAIRVAIKGFLAEELKNIEMVINFTEGKGDYEGIEAIFERIPSLISVRKAKERKKKINIAHPNSQLTGGIIDDRF